jgi:hypothetical protein
LEDWPQDYKKEDVKEENHPIKQGGFESIWGESTKTTKLDPDTNHGIQQEIVNRLLPCNHMECNSCFVNYH